MTSSEQTGVHERFNCVDGEFKSLLDTTTTPEVEGDEEHMQMNRD
jgi:hypothetical protein